MRKRYFIKKRFQAKFIIGFVALLVAQVILIAGLFTYISKSTLTTGYSGTKLVIEKTSNFFFTGLAGIAILSIFIITLAGIIIFIYLTHRIAGPLWRFEKTLKDIAEGTLPPQIRLRKTDQLQGLQQAMNTALEKLYVTIKEIDKEITDLINIKNSPPEIIQKLKKIKEKISFFKTL